MSTYVRYAVSVRDISSFCVSIERTYDDEISNSIETFCEIECLDIELANICRKIEKVIKNIWGTYSPGNGFDPNKSKEFYKLEFPNNICYSNVFS